ncbi:MAG: pseudouridine synthase [Prevotellaceae bacterium]|jgi:23S rRNA pseudouridine2605 synthase|nr:pseudouridine synthase [Prevotellaceae bacterium]
MENSNEETSTYRPRTGSMERKKTASAVPKRAAKSDDGEEKPKRVRKEKTEEEAPAKRATRQSFFKNRTPQAEQREENFDEKPKRAPRKSSFDSEDKPKRAPRKSYDGEEKPRRSFGDDKKSFVRKPYEKKAYDKDRKPYERKPYGDKPRQPRFGRDGEEKPRRNFSDGKPYERKPYERKSYGDDKPRRSFSDDKKPYERRKTYGEDKPFERKPYAKKSYEEKSFSDDARRPRRTFEDKPRKDIRVLDKSKAKAKAQDPNEPVRLNKFIANSGVCSRREADEYIENGEITVNGAVVTELGTKVLITDDIRWNGERLSGEKKVYVLLNKPKGYVTTVEDPHADKTVMDLIAGACKERVYPVGRLDKNTTGVLLFTNDGELTKQLTHPSYNKRKVYHAVLDKTFKKPDMEKLVKGIELEDGLAIADEVGYANLEDKCEVGLEIHSGRNRIVRRMFEALGYEVKKLDRVYFAGLTKKSLERGKWRVLTPKEVSMLKMGAYE